MSEEEKPTEELLQDAIDLYDFESESWDSEIKLQELERLYQIRDQINDLIIRFKSNIIFDIDKKE